MGIDIELWRIRIGTFIPGPKKCVSIHRISLSKGKLSFTMRLMTCLCILLVMGGVEQNPGPPKQQSGRATRASSQSFLGATDSGNIGIACRLSKPEKLANMTQLLTAIRTDMNKNMADIHGKLSTLDNKCDNISQTCHDLQKENSRLSAQNKELQKKVGALENRIDSIEGYSRRNNLILHGIEGNVCENWDDTERKVRNFLCDSLEWTETDSVQIELAHM